MIKMRLTQVLITFGAISALCSYIEREFRFLHKIYYYVSLIFVTTNMPKVVVGLGASS